MQNVVLIIHLLLAISLIGLVLLQRSEGGGLGMGGGAGGGAMSGRAAASALTKLTWGLAIAFICTSLALTILQVQKSSGSSVLDQLVPTSQQDTPVDADALLPPTSEDSAPLLPVAD
ncbi:MAG: preprotein translocase subunit SecG [Planktomarina sp.]|jgi:preprotein translocase subunit SecG|nr:preprotein translocase subunit SecG [Planktomarina sp.]MDG1744927.1 preprotein translocase subunit SecG [Planktomarina sp.]